MPDVELETLFARPDPRNQAIYHWETPLQPAADQAGDVNHLCGHCRSVVILGIRGDVEPIAPPPGLAIRCSACGKYSLFRMSFDTHVAEFVQG